MGLKKLVKGLSNVGKIGAAVGAISLMLPGCRNLHKPLNYTRKNIPEITIPSTLTQQTPDFYKNPGMEFKFYKQTYIDCAKEGVIDSNDVEALEYVLSKTLEEIEEKIVNTAELDLSQNTEMREYMLFIRDMGERDLQELRTHLACKDEWLETKAVKGKFWNYGTGVCFYFDQFHDGNVSGNSLWLKNGESARGLRRLFRDKELYKRVNPKNIADGDYNYPEVLKLFEEDPAKTKFNYWLGLLAGLAIPLGVGIVGYKRKQKRGLYSPYYNDQEAKSILYPLGFGVSGLLILDSVHPLVYPIRLGLPIAYEAWRWLSGGEHNDPRIAPESTVNPPPITPRPKEKTVEKKPVKKFINPFEVDFEEPEEK